MALKTFTAIMRKRDIHVEDGGQAKNWEMSSDGPLFVRLQSWSEAKNHDMFDRLLDHRIRVTIDVIE